MRRSLHPDALLVTFSEAARMLGVDRAAILRLISEQKIQAHPVLTDRIARKEVERFATNYVDTNETDTAERRTLDAPITQKQWGTPSMRVRTERG